jgi:RNA polymerase-binding protein DksA
MTQEEREEYRRILLALGKRLQGDVGELTNEALRKSGGEAGGNLSNTPLHLADLGSDYYEQEMSMSLLETEERQLEDVADALGRIDKGTFGICEECGQEINAERLQAVPYARFCIDCARKQSPSGK